MYTFFKIVVALFIFMMGVVAFPLFYLLVTGDFPGAQVFYGLQEDHEFVTWLLEVRS